MATLTVAAGETFDSGDFYWDPVSGDVTADPFFDFAGRFGAEAIGPGAVGTTGIIQSDAGVVDFPRPTFGDPGPSPSTSYSGSDAFPVTVTTDFAFQDPSSAPVATLTGATITYDFTVAYSRTTDAGGNTAQSWVYTVSFDPLSLFAGDDTVTMAEGNDTFVDPDGALTIFGGLGRDTIITHDFLDGIGDADDEADVIYGGAANDTILYGSDGSSIYGGTGADVIRIADGESAVDVRIEGGSNNDTIEIQSGVLIERQSSFDDTYTGLGGDVTVTYASGQTGVRLDLNTVGPINTGVYGRDTFVGISNFIGSQGADTFIMKSTGGAFADNSINGGNGNDSLSGGDGHDILTGGNNDDTLMGGTGADDLNGGSGLDRVSYANAAGAISVAANNTQATAGEAAGDRLTGIEDVEGSAFGDTIWGSGITNHLYGGAGNDALRGAAGKDTLYGGNGDDRLFGGSGADRMFGDAGADRFAFTVATDSPSSARDIISDFSEAQNDRIDLVTFDPIPGGANDPLAFVGTGPFTGTGQVRYTQQNGNTTVTVNLTGDAAPELTITVAGLHALTADDFIL